MPQCQRHPNVETNLACGKCGTYVCPRCMVQTPVGVRCPDCARPTRVPTFDVRFVHYVRAILAGAVIGGALGYAWGAITPWLDVFWGLRYIALLVAAYLVGEAVSLSVNRKRSRGLGAVAVLSLVVVVVVSAFVSGSFASVWGLVDNFYGFIFVLVAIYIVVRRAVR